MIINIRGTSGSGKSTLVRNVMSLYSSKGRMRKEGRRQPIGYILGNPRPEDIHHQITYIPGHYETACGGCDTINGLDEIYALVEEAADTGAHVLFEGLIVCSDYKRLVGLKEAGYPVLVIGLNTPLDVCIASVQQRREARGNTEVLNPKNTESKYKTNLRVLERFQEAGVEVAMLSRDEALERIRKEFGL